MYITPITDKEKNKKIKSFQKLLQDKKIYKINRIEDTVIIFYENGSKFKCSGDLINEVTIKEFQRPVMKKKRLYKKI